MEGFDDRSAQEQAKKAAMSVSSTNSQTKCPTRNDADSSDQTVVTLHLSAPINAALRGTHSTFRRFVQGWDKPKPWLTDGEQRSQIQEPIDYVLQDLSLCEYGSTSSSPLALRHSVSTPSNPLPGPEYVDHSPMRSAKNTAQRSTISPPISLDPFQRSTSTPAGDYGSFGTSRSAFTLNANAFSCLPSTALERRHSANAFGPVHFYSLALQDAMEQTAIEVEERLPEKAAAARFLSSNARIFRKTRPGGRENPLAVTVLEEQQPGLYERTTKNNSPDTSALSGCSDISAIAPIDEDEDELCSQLLAVGRKGNNSPETSAKLHVTSSQGGKLRFDRQSSTLTGLSEDPLVLSTISETDREVAEANRFPERHNHLGDSNSSSASSASSHRFFVLGECNTVREGASLPVERLFHRHNSSHSQLMRVQTSSSTSSSQQSGTATTCHSFSGMTSSAASSLSAEDPPRFVSCLATEETNRRILQNSPIVNGEERRKESPAVSVLESDVLIGGPRPNGQYRIRSQYIAPRAPVRTFSANEHSIEVCVSSAMGSSVAVITPEKDEASLQS